ncbi:hypothetical protein BDB00DRAFT_826096 [Zychaea mexicana]|uniref:uncharacterized protein n=1 Tax=Zychaea mexicana TaxID=64656 RepID=UPI0022FDCCC0|nr:uncharacterized protein BDB00DRAFT_826096 [Zychaea mexicana]KAI9492903.1 hypothetical protein BDB00DRAFT_826096 [Zychaea mexicana]
MATTTRSDPRVFCPLVLYHDSPSSRFASSLQMHQQSLIDRHREKTTEMLQHNAQVWASARKANVHEKYNAAAAEVEEDEDVDDAAAAADHIDVSPSTSTSSASSASSSSSWTSNNSSCDSIATIDTTHGVRYSSPRLGVNDLLSPEIYPSSKDMPPPPPPPHPSLHHHHHHQHLPVLKQVTPSTTTPPPLQHYPSSTSTSTTASTTTSTNNNKPTTTTTTNIAADTTKKRRRGNLPKEVTEFLKGWLVDHKKHPYPSEKEKIQLANRTGLTVNQISNWFINARRRILQPMLESESLNAQLMAYSEMASLEHKKRRQLDIYAYQGFAESYGADDSRKWAFRRTKLPAFDVVENDHYSLAMR